MTRTQIKSILFAIGAFMAAWQAADFSLDYRAVLGAATAALLGAANPAKTSKGSE